MKNDKNQKEQKDHRTVIRKKAEKVNNMIDTSAIRVIYIQSLPKNKNQKTQKNHKERIKT